MRKLIVFCAAAVLASGALAQQYKWVDRDGRVRYGDVPPPGVKAKALRPVPGAAASAPPAGESAKAPLTPAEQEAAFRKRRIDAEKAREKQAQAAEAEQAKQENCSRARQQLAALEGGQRIVRVDAKGERAFLEDADRPGEIAKARKLVSDWCN